MVNRVAQSSVHLKVWDKRDFNLSAVFKPQSQFTPNPMSRSSIRTSIEMSACIEETVFEAIPF
jgi:hypothetical protein